MAASVSRKNSPCPLVVLASTTVLGPFAKAEHGITDQPQVHNHSDEHRGTATTVVRGRALRDHSRMVPASPIRRPPVHALLAPAPAPHPPATLGRFLATRLYRACMCRAMALQGRAVGSGGSIRIAWLGLLLLPTATKAFSILSSVAKSRKQGSRCVPPAPTALTRTLFLSFGISSTCPFFRTGFSTQTTSHHMASPHRSSTCAGNLLDLPA